MQTANKRNTKSHTFYGKPNIHDRAYNNPPLQATPCYINPLNAELHVNPVCHLLVLLARHIFHVSMIRVNSAHISHLIFQIHFNTIFPFNLRFYKYKI